MFCFVLFLFLNTLQSSDFRCFVSVVLFVCFVLMRFSQSANIDTTCFAEALLLLMLCFSVVSCFSEFDCMALCFSQHRHHSAASLAGALMLFILRFSAVICFSVVYSDLFQCSYLV